MRLILLIETKFDYIPEIFIEISILIQVLELSNMNNVCPGEIFSHPTPMAISNCQMQKLLIFILLVYN